MSSAWKDKLLAAVANLPGLDAGRVERVVGGYLAAGGWSDALRAFFGLKSIHDGFESRDAPRCRLLFAPSFEWDFVLTLREMARATEVTLSTFSVNLYHWCGQAAELRPADPTIRRLTPQWRQETAGVDADVLSTFRNNVSRLDMSPPTGGVLVLCDGMSVEGAITRSDGTVKTGWTLGSGDPVLWEYARAVQRLALDALRQPESLSTVERVGDYFDKRRSTARPPGR